MIEDKISTISQNWFLAEPALFQVFCTHVVVENEKIKCPFRVGKGKIEYNAEVCAQYTDEQLEELLRAEAIRILLKHPYERQPSGCRAEAKALGSNCVLGDGYRFKSIEMDKPNDYKLKTKQHFEFYARQIQRLLPPNCGNGNGGSEAAGGSSNSSSNSKAEGDGNGSPSESDAEGGSSNKPSKSDMMNDLAETWQEDELMEAEINETIKSIQTWGSLPGDMVQQIIASTQVRVDYRKILAGFRASIISQKRHLTRMRPNRRSGFEAMGSRYAFSTRMIVGVDVSGSISDKDLQNFYGTINRFFKYGITQIDVVQFDTQLGKVETLDKASEHITIKGRGGTCFQPFIDFVATHPEYDGALIYTDGYADIPNFPPTFHTPLCWILHDRESLERHQEWMKHSGKVCMIEKNR